MGKAKGTQPSKKTEQKLKEKIIQDKTFGLKNKNKSTKVQKYIKSVENQVLQKKGSQQARIAAQFQQKAEKKRSLAVNALLASVYKDLGKKKGDDKKRENESDEEEEQEESVAVVKGKIDYYSDPRVVRGDIPLHSLSKITCKYFLEAIEKNQYGFRWDCPNKGDNCPYRHFLPQGYILKKDMKLLEEIMKAESKEELPLEERIEQQRLELPSEGLTPVTKETFMAWKVKKQKEKEKLEKIAAMEKKGGGSKILSGKALFKFDPSLFVDDDDATEEYEKEERKEGDEEEEEEEKKEEETTIPEVKNKEKEENGEKETTENGGGGVEIEEGLFQDQVLDDVELE